jgi:Ca2+-binding RTX toxin-like protein
MQIINGTSGQDVLIGTDDADYIYGLGGDDVIEGGKGADQIDGGSGSDIVRGGDGADVIRGDADSSSTEFENDQFYGEEGDDDLSLHHTASTRRDTLLLDGGAGNDRLTFNSWYYGHQAVTLIGGNGNDLIDIIGGGQVTVDAGAGTDRIAFNYSDFALGYTFALGAGADLIVLRDTSPKYRTSASLAIRVTDFENGEGGDRIILEDFLGSLLRWDRLANPFTTGHLSIEQRGPDAVLRIDFNGGGDGWQDLFIFEGAAAHAMIAVNLGWSPDGSQAGPLVLDGGANADVLIGSGGNDLLRGLEGNDELSGGAGDDRLEGGAGDDHLGGGFGNDVLLGGDGRDTLSDSYGGNEEMFGGDGSDLLEVHRDHLHPSVTVLLDGGSGDDELRYQATYSAGKLSGVVQIVGGDGRDSISIFNAVSAVVDGGTGDDYLYLLNGGTAYF